MLSQPRLDVNKQDYSGATALIYAVWYGDPKAARLILSHPDIDVTLQTWAGQCSAGWHGGYPAGKSAIDLVDKLQYFFTRELCEEMRQVFGLPPLPPPRI